MRKGEAVVGLENHTKSVEKELFVFILCNWQLQLLVCLGFFPHLEDFILAKSLIMFAPKKYQERKKKVYKNNFIMKNARGSQI